MTARDVLQTRLQTIRQRMQDACRRSGRSVEDVRLIAVTKYAELKHVRELVELGQLDLGESRPQQLSQRAAELPQTVRWHLIGHLQRNKVELVVPTAALIHSVDSLRLAERISSVAVARGLVMPVLLEVNVSGEESKDGFQPDALRAVAEELFRLPGLKIQGLMTMAPQSDHPEGARPVFRSTRLLLDELRDQAGSAHQLTALSMGMSGDFEIAIEEGATFIRIGSSLFDGLPAAGGHE